MNLFDNTLMTVSPLALVGIWGDLVEAYHGLANFGDAAEIYAYRLMAYSPRAHTHNDKDALREIATQAANALCSIVEEFCSAYACDAEIDDISVDQWCRAHNAYGDGVFDHRCRVRIARKAKRPNGE